MLDHLMLLEVVLRLEAFGAETTDEVSAAMLCGVVSGQQVSVECRESASRFLFKNSRSQLHAGLT